MTYKILSYTFDELQDLMKELGLKHYRAQQLFNWIYLKRVTDFFEMTNISLEERDQFGKIFSFPKMSIVQRQQSRDGTVKLLWKLQDGEFIESVIVRHPNHTTFCISSQVGCPIGCKFCQTGLSGYVRNLEIEEIVGQMLYMEIEMGKMVDNIVFMGMGEPFLNTDNVLKSIRIYNDERGRNLGLRHFTISTVGIPQGITRFTNEGPEVKLSVSLHASSNDKRNKIVPINKKHGIEDIFESLYYYQTITSKRVTFEYVLINHFNDYIEDAQELYELLKGMSSYVNVIPLNPVSSDLKRPSEKRTTEFMNRLNLLGVKAELRIEKGADIKAACGQLKTQYNAGGKE
ncbi:MAG: 23S rRNA (adenine(2503)-C(2))-methyltransferase RlmN [Thermotogota bacterium]|nr:23S rRNA (adenine(2503)-C(2))-methyltransferase RlmN [Thermotogota bacterium]